MNELLEALGFRLEFNDLYIRLIKPIVYVEQASGYTLSNLPGSYLLPYTYTRIPEVLWSYQTEFGEQLERYNAKQYQPYQIQPNYQSYYPIITSSGSSSYPISTGGSSGIYTQQGPVYSGISQLVGTPYGCPGYQGLQQAQSGQNQQLHQAALQQNIYPYGLYQPTNEPDKEPKFILWDKIKKFFK